MAILLQFLIALASLSADPHILMIGDTAHYANLFGVIVGNTAKARKGNSWEVAFIVSVRPSTKIGRPDAVIEGVGSSGEGLVEAVRDPIVEITPDPRWAPTRPR